MKKNVALRVAAILFLVTIIAACFVSELLVTDAGLEHSFLPYTLLVQVDLNPIALGGIYGIL